MIINILTHINGVGLEKDANIIMDILKDHDVNIVELGDHQGIGHVKKCRNADINIFLELLNENLIKYANKNILIPNPEWFFWLKQLNSIDYVLCKTKDCENIFGRYEKRFNYKTIFTSFTSEDMYLKSEKLSYYLHFVGKSELKGTTAVYICWRKFPNLPPLLFGSYKSSSKYRGEQENIWVNYKKMPKAEYKILMNKCLFHLCPSEYEGFGHYIWEGMSAGAIIITTDAPPMNEFINGNGYLVPPSIRRKYNLGTLHKIRSDELHTIIQQTMQLGEREKQEMSKRSRELYLNNDKYFKKVFNQIINTI